MVVVFLSVLVIQGPQRKMIDNFITELNPQTNSFLAFGAFISVALDDVMTLQPMWPGVARERSKGILLYISLLMGIVLPF